MGVPRGRIRHLIGQKLVLFIEVEGTRQTRVHVSCREFEVEELRVNDTVQY